MSSRNNKSKRRRVSEDEQSEKPEVIPSAVGSGSARAGATTSGEVELVSKETWEEIPDILFVKMQEEDEEEVAEALENLRHLLNDDGEDDKNIKTAFRLGAPAVVLLTMKKFQYHQGIQRHGCACLQDLAYLESNRATIFQTGGMESLINALKIFPDSLELQICGVGALVNLTKFAKKDEYMEQFVNDLDGIQLTLAAMERFFDNENVVEYCCGVFWNLAKIKEFHEPMKAAGVMGAVGTALDKYSDNKDVKHCAEGCMKVMMK